jgi:hypothetical protein
LKICLAVLLLAFLVPTHAKAQGTSCFPYCFKCKASVIDPKGRVVSTIEFKPLTGEEELTHKTLDIPGTRLKLHAIVFFTDESLASNAGNDSIELTLAVSDTRQQKRGQLSKKAVAEVTLNSFDTAVVSSPIQAGKKHFAAVMQCQGTEKQPVNQPN